MQILPVDMAKEERKISQESLKFTGESFLSENTDNSGSCITGETCYGICRRRQQAEIKVNENWSFTFIENTGGEDNFTVT